MNFHDFQKIFLESFNIRPALVQEKANAATAVVGFILKESAKKDLSFLLTLRSDHLQHHPGEVCLPGGHIELTDDNNFLGALDRECFEEVALPVGSVNWLRSFDELRSRKGTCVRPYLGFLKSPDEPHLRFNDEVVRAEWCPLESLFDEKLWSFKEFPVWQGFEPKVWGLTAGFLWVLKERLKQKG